MEFLPVYVTNSTKLSDSASHILMGVQNNLVNRHALQYFLGIAYTDCFVKITYFVHAILSK